MNNLAIILTFLLVLVVFFWIMPTKKAEAVTKCLTSLLRVLPVSKICEVVITYFETKRKLNP